MARPEADDLRVARMWRHELKLTRDQGWRGPIAGVDEAGRGPLAGPVVASAVVLPRRIYLPSLNDSKALSATVRERLEGQIKERAIAWSVVEVSVADIDLINILQATHKAMRLALETLGTPFAGALLDGLPVATLGFAHAAVVDGDALCPSIAAASILAKVQRDRMMAELDAIYPEYGFAQHKGYPTPQHIAALRRHGPCPIHRRSFHWHGTTLFDLAELSRGK